MSHGRKCMSEKIGHTLGGPKTQLRVESSAALFTKKTLQGLSEYDKPLRHHNFLGEKLCHFFHDSERWGQIGPTLEENSSIVTTRRIAAVGIAI